MAEMYDDEKHVKDTFTESNLSEYLIQAQWAEFIELKKTLFEIYKRKNSPLKVLDIGVGDARVLKHLVQIEDIWDTIEHYDGIDIAQNCINITNNVVKELELESKVSIKLLDATKLKVLDKKYDIIISTWFTVGNFYQFDFDFKNFKSGYDMTKNDKLTMILEQAYDMLNQGGELMIGSMYIDEDKTRKKQEKAYINWGWKIITTKNDCFTATDNGWWSQRFTKQRVYDYLPFIKKENITFIDLDTYNYAMAVRIKK